MTHKPDDDAAWLLDRANSCRVLGNPERAARLERIAARLQKQDGVREALDCWQTMVESGVPIGGEWLAVRVAHSNDLRQALADTAPRDEVTHG